METKTAVYRGKPMYVAGVSQRKNYVSYHLVPAYLYPDLAKGISPELKRRKQGKGCFNFAKVDGPLFRELRAFTNAAIARFRTQGVPVRG